MRISDWSSDVCSSDLASCRYSRQRRGRSQRQDRSRARGRLDQAVGISCRRRLPMIKTARPRQRADSGFTLLEILIVVAIFGIFALLAYGGLNSVLHTRSRVEIAQNRVAELQKAYIRIDRKSTRLNSSH